MSQASATFPVSLSGCTLPIPPKPLYQDFQFKIIGKEPALLMRLSSDMATHLDDLDMDDIYEEPTLPSSSSMATEMVPSGACSRPTLFQTLASDIELCITDAEEPAATMDVVDFSSLQSTTSIGPPDIPKFLPNTPLPISHSGGHHLWTSSDSPGPAPACAAAPLTNIQDSEHLDRESSTRPTSSPRRLSPSPNDLVLSPSDHDLGPVDNSKALKKVVALKDKFRAVSATARQSQRLAKHALINAQRSAAAAQSCLAAAESFVPCVGDVISAIRRMRHGPASEWIGVLRDLEDDLYDLNQWSSLDTFRRDALGLHLPHLRNVHVAPIPSPGGVMAQACSGFPLTSVEEEAQEALNAWNQLDWQTDCPVDGGRPRRGPGSQRDDGVFPKSRRHCGVSQLQEIRESGNRVPEAFTGDSTENLERDRERREQENFQSGGPQLIEAEVALEPRREVEESVPITIETEAKDSQERQNSRDQMHDQSRPAQICEDSPVSRGEEPVLVSTAASSDIGKVTSKKTLADYLQSESGPPQTTSIGHVQAISTPQENVYVAPLSLQDRDARNLQPGFRTPITEDDTEQMPAPTANPSDDMQAEQQLVQPQTPSSALPVAPRNGVDSPSANQAHPSTPIPTTSSISEAVGGDSELSKIAILRSKITPEVRTSVRLPMKVEPVEPQLNLQVERNNAVDGPLPSNESLAKSTEVEPAVNTPLKPDSKTPVVSLNSSPEIKTKLSCRVSSVDLPAPLPKFLPPVEQKPAEVNIPPSSTGPATSDSVKVSATQLISPHNILNNGTPAQATRSPVSSDSPTSPSIAPLATQLAPVRQPASAVVHSPTSAVPLALRVEKRPASHSNSMRDLDESISPDLYSRGWDADENDGSRRGSWRSPSRFEPVPRNRSRDVEGRNQYVDDSTRSMQPRSHLSSLGSRLSRSPDGRRPISSYEYPGPLIGKKRPRDEVSHPLPPRNRRDWTGTAFASTSGNQVSHVDSSASPHSQRSGLSTTPVSHPSNNSLRHHAPSLIHRLDPSSEPMVEAANGRIQRPFPQQPPQNRPRQNNAYNVGHPSSYSRQSHHGYDNDQTPELLNRMTSSQPIQYVHNTFDSGHSHSNVGRPSNRPHGRGRGFGGQGGGLQQQRVSRKPPSLYDRLDNKP